jgi:tRNA pseudouridine38-40 synthase
MARYFLELAYDGTDFIGWQRQPKGRSVQGVLDAVLSTLAKHPVVTMGSGRTDIGVHASGQVAHFELLSAQRVNPERLLYQLNAMLPADIACHKLYPVDDRMHARFSAKGRTYEYHVGLHKNPFNQKFCTQLATKILNRDAMQEAASYLIGQRSFRTFSKFVPDEHYLCHIYNAQWEVARNDGIFHSQDPVYRFTVTANRFLRGQVRAMVGAMLEIGRGKYPPIWMRDVLAAELTQVPTKLAPAQGLCLVKVEYETPAVN